MKLHLPKQLFTALLAALTLAAPAALTLGSAAWGAEETIIKYDAAGNVIPADDTSTEVVRTETVYTATSTLDGVGTSAAQIGDSGNSFNLINYVDADTDASKLVIEGNGQGIITTTSNNGGWGGRVTFAALASDATTYCQDVTLTKGIEADITNIQGNGNIVLTVDNASIYGSTNNYAVTLNIGDDGVRFNGGSSSSYTWSGVVTGTGDVVVLVGNENTTLTLTGDTSSYSGTWTTSTSRVFAFGNGGACANGQVGGNVSNNSGAWYNYAGSYEVLGSINTGTIKVNGGEATFSGNILATTAMEIATGASATISGNATTVGLTNNGELTVADTGTLTVSGASALGSTIVNNGTLNLNGNLTASEAGVFSLAATGTGLNTARNGFYENVTYVLATGSGTVNVGEGVTLTLGSGDAVTTPALMGGGTNTVYFNEAADSGTYYVFADTSASAVEADVNARKESEAEFALSSIYVNSGSTLSYDSGSFSSVSLKGNGVYDAGATKTMTSGLTVDSSWRGTVKIYDSTNDADIQLNTLGVAGSTVDISNVSGYFQSGSSSSSHAIIAPDINLSGNLTITNGYNGSFYEFHGKLSGTGNLNLERSGGPTNTFYFMNDISRWTGTLNHTKQTDNIYLQGGANEINAEFNRTGGTLNLYVETNAAATFSKAVTVSNLTLNQSATFTNALTVANAATIAAGKTLTLDGNVTSSITGNLTNNGALVVQNGGTLSINSAITNAGSLTIADGAKLQINSLSGYNYTADYTLSGEGGTYGYQEGLTLTYNLVTGAGSFTLNGSVMLGETDITSSVTNGQYIVASTENVYEITGAYTGPVIEYNGSSGDTAQADSFIVREGASLKITDTANSNGALGKNVSGAGTLIIAAAANDTISFTGSSMADFTGTVDVTSGAVYLGNVAGANSGAAADFAASKIIVRNGAAFWTHMSAETLGADIDLLSGATLGNKDKNNDYQGNIRFNIVDPDAETASYNKDGVVTINQYWQKNVKFSGLLEGDGIVQMKAANVEANANYELSNASNTFAGTYKLIDGDNANNSGKTTTLKLSSATAAQYATIDLASTGAVSVLKLAGNSTIAALYGSDADNYVTTDATGTLTVSEGSFGGKMQNGSNATLSLTKTGSGTLTLSGALGTESARLGTVSATAGELALSGAGYVSTLEISGDADVRVASGGNLNVTTFNASTGGTDTDRNVYIENGARVTAANFNVNWNMGSVAVNGVLDVTTELYLGTNNRSNTTELLSGTGEIEAAKFLAGNNGSYGVNVATLSIGSSGLEVKESAVLNLASATTTVDGTTTVNSGNVLNFNAGSATLYGAVTNTGSINVNGGSAMLNGAVTNTGSINVKGGSTTLNGGISGAGTVALTGGSLILGSSEGVTNEIAQFNYSGGTLSHSGLTVTNATFSGATLDNTANGTLTLNGTLNVTNIGGLTKGEGSYSGGAVEGNGYYTGSLTVITGNNNLSYGDSFALQLNGSALTEDSTNTSFYTKSENGTLTLKVTDTSTFIVNTGTESLTYDTAAAYHVAAGATLEFSGTQAAEAVLTKSVTGTGTVKVTFDTSNHNESVQFGDGFNGELEVSGYMHLANFSLGKDATIKLASGQVWNQSATTSAYKILLAGENEESFSFIGSELTLTGEVTGTYLTTSTNMNLLNAANNITQVKVKGGTTKLNAGTYDTVKVAGGTVNVTGGSVTTVDYTGSGTVNFKLAQGQSATSYTLNEIKNTGTTNYVRNLTVDSGVTLTTGNLTNSWGMGTMTINGTLIVNGEMKFATANNNSTSNNVLTGSGIVHTEKLIIDNAGKYNFSGLTLKIGSGGIIKGGNFWGDHVMLNLGALTIEATEDWSSDLNKIQLVGATGAPTVFNTAGHTITMSAGGISGTGELKKAGEGTLVLSGANSYTGATTVEGGTLQITEAAAVNSSAGVSMESGALLKYTGSGTETLSTPLSGAGSFTMAGSGTLTLSGANTYTGGTTVQEGELIISSAGSLGTGSVQLEAGSTLTLGASVTNAIQVNGAGANINLSNGVTLTHNGKVTINDGASINYTLDNAILDLSSTAITSGISSIDMKNGSEVQLHSPTNHLGDENARVAINMSGDSALSLKNGADGTVWADINVDGSGSILGSVYGNNTIVKGSIKGNGSLLLGRSDDTWSNAWKIESHISDNESGKLSVTFNATDGAEGPSKVTLSGANTYSGGTTIENGHLYTENASALGTGGVNMTGGELVVRDVANTDTDLTVGGAIVMNAAATAKLATSGTTLSLGTAGSVKKSNADGSQHVTIASDGTNAASMTAKADNAQLVQLQEDASFTIQDMTLTNTTITAATTTQVKLQNVTASNVVLAQGKFSTDADMGVTVGMGGSGSSLVFEGGLESDTITINASTGASLAVDLGDLSCVTEMNPGKYNLSITLSGVELDSYTGLSEGAGITFEGWLGELIGASSDVKVSFSAVEEATSAAAAEGGAATGVTYSTGSVGTVITITGLNVPEPTTATLSLLALAALAARRRRND